MKSASLIEIKKELESAEPSKLIELCLRAAKYKKEIKELFSYLLFEAHNEAAYVNSIKEIMNEEMKNVNLTNLYFAKKNLRRILRLLDRFIRFSGKKETDADLRIHFCIEMKNLNLQTERSKALRNLYATQVSKIKTAVSKLHEDLQFDYRDELENL